MVRARGIGDSDNLFIRNHNHAPSTSLSSAGRGNTTPDHATVAIEINTNRFILRYVVIRDSFPSVT